MIRVFTSRRCLAHRAPGGYPERPERLEAILEHLAAARPGALVEAPGAEVSAEAEAAVLAVHDERYVRRLRRAVERGDGLLDSPDNPLSAGTWDAAMAAAEVTLSAARWAAAGGGRHAFAAVRPPGHHAERGRAMGFCFFDNVALAVEDLRRRALSERAAILDVDVHHGNGTQHLFEERPDVFYASLHQWPFYPGTGRREERGVGDGAGTVFNVPLPAGTGDSEFLAAVDGEVLPALRGFAPDFLAVSAGFDAWRADPLGGMRLSEECFGALGERMAAFAAELAGSPDEARSLTVLEGGYDVQALPRLVETYLRGLEEGSERRDRD